MVRNQINVDLYARNAELAVRNKTLSLLHKLDQVTLSTLTTEEMTGQITATLAKEFLYPFVGIGVCDKRQSTFEWMSIACPDGKSTICERRAYQKSFSLKTIHNACTQVIASHRRAELSSLHKLLEPVIEKQLIDEVSTKGQIKSVLVFPLIVNGACVGVLAIGLNRSKKDLTKYEQDTFTPLLGLVTIALQKAMTYSSLVETTKKLRVANRRLKELDALKTEFLSIASHQLRTPMAAIRGYVDLIMDGSYGKLSDQQTEVVGKIHSSVEGLIELVGQLLNVSRIESGKTVLTIEPIDIVAIATDVTGFLSIKATEQKLNLVLTPATVVPVMGDAAKVKEVLMNVIENALKYTDQGGVTVSFVDEPKAVRVNVTDTGIGLDKNGIDRLFQKFSRVEASAANHPGTGLGLYVCKRLIEAMGGEIWVESPGLGKGSIFSFRLKKAPTALQKTQKTV
ncbi:MAG: Sensor histidine kinase [Patescibacteria group bacterium]|nr:Sensor histidine kinase [Patescibacteria group bacterium]